MFSSAFNYSHLAIHPAVWNLIKKNHSEEEASQLEVWLYSLAFENSEEFSRLHAMQQYYYSVDFWRSIQRSLEVNAAQPNALSITRDEDNHADSHSLIYIHFTQLVFFAETVLMLCQQQGLKLSHVLQYYDAVQQRCWVQINVTHLTELQYSQLVDALRCRHALNQTVVKNWPAMRTAVLNFALKVAPSVPELAELANWLAHEHFILLGVEDGEQTLGLCANGLILDPLPIRPSNGLSADAIQVGKLASHSPLQRDTQLDFVYLNTEMNGILVSVRIVGLFTSAAAHASLIYTPYLRKKYAYVLEQAPHTQQNKWRHVLENIPRHIWWPLSREELAYMTEQVVGLFARPRLKVLAYQQNYVHNYLIYLPKEQYTPSLLAQLIQLMHKKLALSSLPYQFVLDESPLARLSFSVATEQVSVSLDADKLEKACYRLLRGWHSELSALLAKSSSVEQYSASVFLSVFNAEYQQYYTPEMALNDILRLKTLQSGSVNLMIHTYYNAENALHLRLLQTNNPITLSSCLHVLENMGIQVLDEHPHHLPLNQGLQVYISDFSLKLPASPTPDYSPNLNYLEDAFLQINAKGLENDGFNRLILLANISAREVNVLRAYWKFWRQAGAGYSQPFIENCLAKHAILARQLIDLFYTYFSPFTRGDAKALLISMRSGLQSVIDLDEDKILNQFLAMIQATVRTNFFQANADGSPKSILALKLQSEQLAHIVDPKPLFEIFVYAPHMEGVHLRGGKVARGGIRWSERLEDYRTEILGLLKTQMIKNAGIVPVGAKGGFICKPSLLTAHLERQEMGVLAYQDYIRALLDLTDNFHQDVISHPALTICRDGNDPYLVIAADKGTAGFSDIANAIANAEGFWLQDAFASGGSNGYNHKEMGITARGAWQSLQQHALALGQSLDLPFTAVGIGDMSGDVFGNGVLLSPNMQLIAAFDHRHIFLDPNPNPALSFIERQRLFKLKKSSWADYHPAKISIGGGVFSRQSKIIELSTQIKKALSIQADRLSPAELIQAILRAPVFVLYNGGIGTYIKAAAESNAEANDRANDAVRIDAEALRCQVIVEGGNLGLTQAARVVYALQNGRIHTDSIDNSGGVECSDLEVNLKILLQPMLQHQEISREEQQKILRDLTPFVQKRVLTHQRANILAIELAAIMSPPMINMHARYLQQLDARGELNRKRLGLPNDEAIQLRKLQKKGLIAPELAVLIAQAKLMLYPEILASDIPDDTAYLPYLSAYFPDELLDLAQDYLPNHYLKREIISTQITSQLVNRMGLTFVFRLEEETGASAAHVTRAWLAACAIFQADSIWAQLAQQEAMPNVAAMPLRAYLDLHLELRKLLERSTRWILRNYRHAQDIFELVQDCSADILSYRQHLFAWHPNLPIKPLGDAAASDLVHLLACVEQLFCGLDIVQLHHSSQQALPEVSRLYFELGALLQMDWLLDSINILPRDNRWQNLARLTLRDDLYRMQRSLTAIVLQLMRQPATRQQAFMLWTQRNQEAIGQCQAFISDLRTQPNIDLAMLSSALREIRNRLLTGHLIV